MSYYIAKTLPVTLEEAIDLTEAALTTEGFGVLTKIDIASTLK